MIDWNEIYSSGADFRAISRRDIDSMLEYLPSPTHATSLDIGCGTGQLTRELWHRGFAPTGIDTSEAAIKLAKSYTVLDDSQIKYRIFDLETQDAADLGATQFTLITCKLVYAFINDKAAFLRNVSRLLAKDGVFVILTPLKDQVPKEKAHIAVEYDQTLRQLEVLFAVETQRDDTQVIFICKLREP
jgi:2-polyprenyl-3-methyl-5-hydroxy-6-metoxy-1,4-benzoquinol methylase